jgi:putative ABC transport system permease protein
MTGTEREARDRGRAVTNAAAMLVDAWHELRVNRLRILLALVGITVAVVGLTGALGFGQLLTDVQTETSERQGGRTATVIVEGQTSPEVLERLERLPNDFGVEQHALSASANATVWTPVAQVPVALMAVEPAYGEIYRSIVAQGRFIDERDADLLAPAIVVNEKLWEAIGSPDLATNARIQLFGDGTQQAYTLVGVAPNQSEYDSPSAWIPYANLQGVPGVHLDGSSTQLSMWVPADMADLFAAQLSEQLSTSGLMAYRNDWAARTSGSFEVVQWFVIGAAAGMFALGALGLVNINLVTMQHRVREIGIRRSYGATSARIFFGVLLESVLATFVAGVVGVVLTVAVIQGPWLHDWLRTIGVYEPRPFPLSAVFIGLAASTAVGALAGALPALRAMRIQIIDAIRY